MEMSWDHPYVDVPIKTRLKYVKHAGEGGHGVCARAIAGTTAWRRLLPRSIAKRVRLPKPYLVRTRACSDCASTFLVKLMHPINTLYIQHLSSLDSIVTDITRHRREVLSAAARHPRLWSLFTSLSKREGWPLDMDIISNLFRWSEHYMFKVYVLNFLEREQERLDLYRLTSEQVVAILTGYALDSVVKSLLSYHPNMPNAVTLVKVLAEFPERGYIIIRHVDLETRQFLLHTLFLQLWQLPTCPPTPRRRIKMLARGLLNGQTLSGDCLMNMKVENCSEYVHCAAVVLHVWMIHRHVQVPNWIFRAPERLDYMYKSIYLQYRRVKTRRFFRALFIVIVGSKKWFRDTLLHSYRPEGRGYYRALEHYKSKVW